LTELESEGGTPSGDDSQNVDQVTTDPSASQESTVSVETASQVPCDQSALLESAMSNVTLQSAQAANESSNTPSKNKNSESRKRRGNGLLYLMMMWMMMIMMMMHLHSTILSYKVATGFLSFEA
jgi:hypothetical protein